MKRVIVLLFICLLAYLCISELFTTSNSFQIDYTKLHIRNDYSKDNDIFPQNISETMTLLRNNNLQESSFDFSGEYHRSDVDDTFGMGTDFVWERFSSEGDINLKICFHDDGSCILMLPDENKEVYYIYNDGEILFKDQYYNFDIYSCEFKYPNVEEQPVVDLFSSLVSDFTTSAITYDTNVVNNIQVDTNAQVQSKNRFQEFLENVIMPWGWEIIAGGMGSAILFVFIYNRTSQLLKKTYKRRLQESLFPQEHSWFGNNSPDDVYVSVKVFLHEGAKEYNLLDYFSSALSNNESDIHVILGNAGSGKTFSLSRIALGILEGFNFSKKDKKDTVKKLKKLIPIILNCSEMSECKNNDDIINSIYDKICIVSQKHRRNFFLSAQSHMRKIIMHYLSLGKFVLLFDGYDEVANTETRLAFSSVLIKFMEEYENCNFILTSRTQIYEKESFYNIPPEKTLYLSPLSKEQIREFLGKWSFPPNKSGTELYRRIINTVQLENVASNPLLLTMIAHTYSKSDFLFFGGRLTLYKQCCECLLKNWEVKKSLLKRIKRYTTLDNVELKIELLSLFAYYLYKNKYSYIKESDLLQLWNNHNCSSTYFHGKVKDVLDDIINQSGLIEKTDSNSLRFRHRSFFEYFVAIFMAKFTNTPININNILNDQNILFFYLSMVNDESIVIEFITKNTKYIKLIQEILIERKIKDNHLVCMVTDIIVKTINFEDIAQIQSLGYIAKQYIEVRPTVKSTFIDKLYNCTCEKIKVNIIIGLMIFCEKNSLCDLLKELNEINLQALVQYAGDVLNDLAKEIMELISNEQKILFIEFLAKTCRFEAIYNIYKQDSKDFKDLAVIGFLYMSHEASLLNWLEAKKFYENASSECQISSQYLQNKYGWIEKESPNLTKNLFLLIYLSKEIIKGGFKPKKHLIKNQIAFLLSYIISEEESTMRDDLVDIQGFKVESISEFSYHWNRRKHNKEKGFVTTGHISIPTLNFAIVSIVFLLIFSQTLFYLNIYAKVSNIFYQGWDIQIDTLYNFSFLPFNACYIVFLLALFLVGWLIYSMLRKVNYGVFSILLFITCALMLSFIYELFVQNFVFRIISILSIIFVGFLESIKHRNNYPSFKEPQYSKILEFLA